MNFQLNGWVRGAFIMAWLFGFACDLKAEVSVPAFFSDHMMLQAGAPAPVWGRADPGEEVTVTFSGRMRSARANAAGEWKVIFDDLVSGESGTLTIKATNTLTIRDVLVGEVWLASGQSNMHLNLAQMQRAPGVSEALASSTDPWVRQFTVVRGPKSNPVKGVTGFWRLASRESLISDRLNGDSAVAYFFSRELRRRLNRPVGVLHASIGATPIETWSKGGEGFERMVRPMAPFGIRGFLWYQGESNVHRFTGSRYAGMLADNVAFWRTTWGLGEIPFLFVQVAPYRYSAKAAAPSKGRPVSPLELPLFWEAQSAALKAVPRSGMAVIHDVITDLDNIHPENKRVPGERLALLAASLAYGDGSIVSAGPMFESVRAEGDCLRIRFTSVGSGLASRDGAPLDWFEVAGEDRKFVQALATLEKDSVVVRSPLVIKPVAVRFAWHETARPNLMNKEGLPAAPFRTDAWPMQDPRASDHDR